MRILIAVYARGVAGGVETYVRSMAPELVARGHRVALLHEFRYEAPATQEADPFVGCDLQLCVQEAGATSAAAAARAWRPDLVWNHGLKSNALEAELLGLAPAVLFAHNHDGLCATGTRFLEWPTPRPCTRAFGAACAAVNFTCHCGIVNPLGFARSYAYHRRRRQNFPRYRALQVASRHMAAELERHGVLTELVQLCPYPLTTPRGPAPETRQRPATELLMLSRLTANKGGLQLLEAMEIAEKALGRRLHLVIAGEGPERWTLIEYARRRNLAVDFPGWVDAAQRLELLQHTDILAVPSLWPEPFGLVGLEAAAAAVPAVSFADGGIVDWLQPGRTGELAPARPPSAAGFAQALVRALGDRAHLERLRQQAWETCAEYDAGRHLERLAEIFQAAAAVP